MLSKDSSMWDLPSGQAVRGPNPDKLSQMVQVKYRPPHPTQTASVYVPFLVVGSVFLAFVMLGALGATCYRHCLQLEQEVAPEGTGGRGGGGVHVLETVPMTASTSIPSAWSWVQPPNPAYPESGRVSPHAPFPQCPGFTVALSHVGYRPSVSPCPPPGSTCTSVHQRYMTVSSTLQTNN